MIFGVMEMREEGLSVRVTVTEIPGMETLTVERVRDQVFEGGVLYRGSVQGVSLAGQHWRAGKSNIDERRAWSFSITMIPTKIARV